jgi:predicted transcriptional regulator
MLGIQGGNVKKVPFEEALKQKTVDWPVTELKSLGVVI